MEARRPGMALRPPQPVATATSSASRPRTLKRTISKCGLDGANSASDLNAIAPKKLAPLHEPSHHYTPRAQFPYQQQQQQYDLPANTMYVDNGEPVLLPRHAPYENCEDDGNAHEYSPVAPCGYDDTPNGAKNRYYESILESTNAFVSPSPQHILYAYTPNGGVPSTSSTVSFGSSHYSPYPPSTSEGVSYNNNSVGLAYNGPVSHEPTQDREYLNAANLHAIMVTYLEEIFQFYDLAKTFTFAKVGEMVASVPFAFRYIQGLVKNRLGISWHLVNAFVDHVMCFMNDEDIREADMKEFADFLRSIQQQLYETMPPGNIFLNLPEFFHTVLAKFKKFLIVRWIELRRIQFPCEFGKKSETLFLCMECHREHL